MIIPGYYTGDVVELRCSPSQHHPGGTVRGTYIAGTCTEVRVRFDDTSLHDFGRTYRTLYRRAFESCLIRRVPS